MSLKKESIQLALDAQPARPLLRSEEVDEYEEPIGYISPEEYSQLQPYQWPAELPENKRPKLRKKVKLINNSHPTPDEQNPWYLRFLHGAKAGSMIGAAAGAIATPAAPLVSTAIGTLAGAGVGGIVGVVGGWLPSFSKNYLPKVYEFFYPPYVEVDLELTDDEYEFLQATKIFYRPANYPSYRPASLVNKEEVITDEVLRKVEFNQRKQRLSHGIYVRYLYPQKPSEHVRPNIFFKWDINTLMGGMGGVTIGAAVGALVGILGGPLGIVAGAAIGGVVGGVIGVIASVATPHIAQRTTPTVVLSRVSKENPKLDADDESLKLEPGLEAKKILQQKVSLDHIKNPPKRDPSWYEESPNDITWYVRLAVGSAAGAVIGGLVGSVVPGIGTAIGTAAGALIFGAAAGVSPYVFNWGRKLVKAISSYFDKKPDPVKQKDDLRDDQDWPQSLKEDPWQLNWYVRMMPGMAGGAAIGAALGTVVPGIGTLIGGLAGAAIGGALAVASPMIFAGVRKLVTGVKSLIFSANPVKPAKKQEESAEFDVPWYFRAFGGAIAGASIGGTIGLVAGSIVPGIGNLVGVTVGAAIGTLAGAGVVLAWPPLRDGAVSLYSTLKSTLTNEPYVALDVKEVSEAQQDKPKTIPWFIRAMAGSMAGGIIGGAIGTIVGSIVPGIGTVIGAAAGAAIGGAAGAVIYVFVPMITDAIFSLFSKPAEKTAANEQDKKEKDHDTDLAPKPVHRVTSEPSLDSSAPAFNAAGIEERDAVSAQALKRAGSGAVINSSAAQAESEIRRKQHEESLRTQTIAVGLASSNPGACNFL